VARRGGTEKHFGNRKKDEGQREKVLEGLSRVSDNRGRQSHPTTEEERVKRGERKCMYFDPEKLPLVRTGKRGVKGIWGRYVWWNRF